VQSYDHLWQDAVRRQARAAADALRVPEGATFAPRLHAPRARVLSAPGAAASVADRRARAWRVLPAVAPEVQMQGYARRARCSCDSNHCQSPGMSRGPARTLLYECDSLDTPMRAWRRPQLPAIVWPIHERARAKAQAAQAQGAVRRAGGGSSCRGRAPARPRDGPSAVRAGDGSRARARAQPCGRADRRVPVPHAVRAPAAQQRQRFETGKYRLDPCEI
jgi:hypothetical protein